MNVTPEQRRAIEDTLKGLGCVFLLGLGFIAIVLALN